MPECCLNRNPRGSLSLLRIEQIWAPRVRRSVLLVRGDIPVHAEPIHVHTGALQSAGVWFDLSATDEFGDPLTSLVTPMTVTDRYLNDGSIPTDTLKLYWWNGTEYVDEGIAQIARTDCAVTSTVAHLTLFNLMSEGPDLNQRVYLPLVIR